MEWPQAYSIAVKSQRRVAPYWRGRCALAGSRFDGPVGALPQGIDSPICMARCAPLPNRTAPANGPRFRLEFVPA